MKICFDNVNFLARTGPNTFAKRLAEQFYFLGIEIVDQRSNYDVLFAFIEPTCLPRKGSRLVQRLDGFWFKPEEFLTKNNEIRTCYKTANLVVWQSEFDRLMSTRHWGRPKNGKVIHNGIAIKPLEQITDASIANLRNKYDKIFVSSSNWHPQKRLKSNIELFEHVRNFYPNSSLIIMGSNPDVCVSDAHVFYTGNISQEKYLEVFAASDWMFHLAWLDHCPNVVLESLSQGTPVVCSADGGTKELVCEYGIILEENIPYNYELTNYDEPPSVDVTQVTKEMLEKPLGTRANIDISKVAKDYIKEFELLVS